VVEVPNDAVREQHPPNVGDHAPAHDATVAPDRRTRRRGDPTQCHRCAGTDDSRVSDDAWREGKRPDGPPESQASRQRGRVEPGPAQAAGDPT
jgi:hypothetical protein